MTASSRRAMPEPDADGYIDHVHPNPISQEDSISYECAGEAMTHAMAIVSGMLHDPDGTEREDPQGEALQAIQDRIADERRDLFHSGPAGWREVRSRYGAMVRAGRTGMRRMAQERGETARMAGWRP